MVVFLELISKKNSAKTTERSSPQSTNFPLVVHANSVKKRQKCQNGDIWLRRPKNLWRFVPVPGGKKYPLGGPGSRSPPGGGVASGLARVFSPVATLCRKIWPLGICGTCPTRGGSTSFSWPLKGGNCKPLSRNLAPRCTFYLKDTFKIMVAFSSGKNRFFTQKIPATKRQSGEWRVANLDP